LSASQKSGGDVALQLLDVQLPKSIYDPYQAANREPKAWEPSPDDIALLRKQWSKLPPATNKDWRKSEVVYAKVDFTLVSPDKYAEAFQGQGAGIADALPEVCSPSRSSNDTARTRCRPERTSPGHGTEEHLRGAQRERIAARGKQFTGYMAAGPGVPIPISFNGPSGSTGWRRAPRLRRLRNRHREDGGPPGAEPASRPSH